MVDTDAMLLGTPERSRRTRKLPSAAPSPPGKTRTDPNMEEKEKIKVEVKIERGLPR